MAEASGATASIPNILSIAGSDPSGGAGVQADLKAIAAMGGYGMAALTALTAQNTRRVAAAQPVEADFVRAQILTIYEDVRVDAVKIGMLATAEIAVAVAAALREAEARRIVLDPVMIATSGDRLLAEDAVAAIVSELAPMAAVITPNLPEAAALAGRPEPTDRAGMAELAQAMRALGAQAALVKGGHLPGDESPDVLAAADGVAWFESPRRPGRPIHGGGCTLSSALATALAQGGDPRVATRRAKAYVDGAVATADAPRGRRRREAAASFLSTLAGHMSEALFYHLTRRSLGEALPALLNMTLQRGWRAVVRCGSRERVEDLNRLLWTFSDESFLPHGGPGDGAAERQPVYLTAGEETPNAADVLFLVDGATAAPEEMARFARACLLFDGRDAEAVAAARGVWKAVTDAGFKAAYWAEGAGGKWEKKAEKGG